MKKILIIITITVMTFTITGCGCSKNEKKLVNVRWDPDEYAHLLVKELKLTISYKDFTKEVVNMQMLHTNGILLKEGVFFLLKDPQFFASVKNEKKVDNVLVEGVVQDTHNQKIEEEVNEILMQSYELYGKTNESFLGKIKNKILNRRN